MAGLLDLTPLNQAVDVDIPDAQAVAGKALGLQAMVREQQLAPMKARKLQLEVAEKEFQESTRPYRMAKTVNEAAKSKQDALTAVAETWNRIYGLAQGGNELAATQLAQSVTGDKTAVVALPEDQKLRSAGYIEVVQGNTRQYIDTVSQERVKKHIQAGYDIMIDLAKKKNAQKFNEKNWIRDTALSLNEKGTVDTPREGIQLATAMVNALGADGERQPVYGSGKPPKSLSELKPESFAEVASATASRQAMSSTDPLDVSLATRSKPDAQLRTSFDKGLGFLQSLTKQVLPAFKTLSDSAFITDPGFLGGTINSALETVSAQPELVGALELITTKATFDQVLDIAATTFSAEIVEEVQKLIPTRSDRVDVAYAKLSMMSVLQAESLNRKLDVADAALVNVKGMRQLLARRLNTEAINKGLSNNSEQSAGLAAETVLNLLGPEIRADKDLMASFTRSLPTPYQRAMISAMEKQGVKMPTETVQSVFEKDLLGQPFAGKQ